MDVEQRKDAIRRTVLARRGRLTAEERAARALALAERLFSIPEVSRARAALCFASFGTELPTDAILDRLLAGGARLFLPYVSDEGDLEIAAIASMEDLAPGYRAIREPRERIPASTVILDVAIVPGVAFDAAGRRLGYGGGFFDRFLAALPRGVPRLGICFDLQVVEEVPTAEGDERVDLIVTEERVLDGRQQPSA